MTAYNSPGVNVTESVVPATAALLSTPSIVCILGAAAGSQSASERLVLSGTTPQVLRYSGITLGSVVVKSSVTAEVLNPGNYVAWQSSDPNAAVTGDEIYSIQRVALPTAPTVATGTGTLSGVYVYAVSFVNSGGETGIGVASSQITLTAQGTSLSAIPVGPAPATGIPTTTARNIYRAKVTAGVVGTFHLVATVADNTTTTLTNETTSDVVASAAATPKTAIQSGDTVVVTYSYTDQYYNAPTQMTTYGDVVDKYGNAFDSNGLIQSPLSLATRFAFLNGASEIWTVAVPNSDADFSVSLAQLEAFDNLSLIVAASGSTVVAGAVKAHVDKMNAAGVWRHAQIGLDGSVTPVTADTLRTTAKTYNDEAVSIISPATFTITNFVTGRPLVLGGQYVAAGYAGMAAARDVEVPLTRRTLAGFTSVYDTRTNSDLILDSQAGLVVIEDKQGTLRVRHSITTAPTNVNSREFSVVRAKYDMARRLRDTLDQSVVGVVTSQALAPLLVTSAVQTVLEQLVVEGSISSYNSISARLLVSDPTTVEVRYGYSPAYPINNINVIFTINTQSGDLSLVTP